MGRFGEGLRKLFEKRERGDRCMQCGICCDLYSWHLKVDESDLARWREEGRLDLLRRTNELGWIWINPSTGEREELCPFITRNNDEKVFCGIHETKPKICREYPTMAHDNRCVMNVSF